MDIIVTVEEVVVIDITDILDDVVDKDWFTPYFGMEILLVAAICLFVSQWN